MFIIDFDDTLFNTHAYKQARLRAMKRLGVLPELFWKTYERARTNEDGIFTYSDINHAEILGSLGFDEEKIFKALQKVTNKLENYIFSDSGRRLRHLHLFFSM